MKVSLKFWALLIATAVFGTGCAMTGGYNLPPAQQLMEPGPGVGGPGPGVLSDYDANLAMASYAGGAPTAPTTTAPTSSNKVQVLFAQPKQMQIYYDVSGSGSYDSAAIMTPARQNFYEGGIYRLKLTGVPGREGVELYPTIEVRPTVRRTAAYLAHNAIPVQFTEEDFDQILSGNFVTKVIYLPDPEFQELALAGVETLVSTRLDPGLDPVLEAERRGAVMAILRIGNKDMEIPGTSDGVVAGMMQAGGVMPASYGESQAIRDGQVAGASFGCASCGPGGHGSGSGCMDGSCGYAGPTYGAGGMPPGLAGAGMYGMPISGTPIGLPGPPHVPLGVPAGLQKHVVHNWTRQHIPDPVDTLKINVKQRPGISYPQPPSRAWITEDTIHPQPHYSNRHFGTPPTGQLMGGAGGGMGGFGQGGLLGGLRGKLNGGAACATGECY